MQYVQIVMLLSNVYFCFEVMMALRRKKREMMRDIEICQNELSAKEAVLTEVVRMINRLPQHPSSAPLIAVSAIA